MVFGLRKGIKKIKLMLLLGWIQILKAVSVLANREEWIEDLVVEEEIIRKQLFFE